MKDNKPAISLRTDFVDADLKGYYNLADLGMFKNSSCNIMSFKVHGSNSKRSVKKRISLLISISRTLIK